jgi:hypothetical protein
MTYALSVDVYCAAGVGDLAATVELADGARHDVVLANGQLDQAFPARPRTLRIAIASPSGAKPPAERERADDLVAIGANALFDAPLAIPDHGRLALEVMWSCECHGEQHVVEPDGKFGSYEHIQCAEHVGKDGAGNVLLASIQIFKDTRLKLPSGTKLRFGELLCLAGDFFAHYDRESAELFKTAWPPLEGFAAWIAGSDYRDALLAEATPDDVGGILKRIHHDGADPGSAFAETIAMAGDALNGDMPMRRYLALASQNFCHFGEEAVALYRGYHELACKRARAAGANAEAWVVAVATEAFACHFLTDLHATGHMRTPRRKLGNTFGVLRGALKMSKAMHDEDNKAGMWVTTRKPTNPRVVWRAYGDGRLLIADAKHHLAQVQEAVRRSVWELYEANAQRPVPDAERAEHLLPVPLPPNHGPKATDVFPDGTKPVAGDRPNHAPLYVLLPNGHIGERHGAPDSERYRDLESDDPTPIKVAFT